jgi:hypothetical protein
MQLPAIARLELVPGLVVAVVLPQQVRAILRPAHGSWPEEVLILAGRNWYLGVMPPGADAWEWAAVAAP